LPNIYKALGSIPITALKEREREGEKEERDRN
jgi:hypothetical protein